MSSTSQPGAAPELPRETQTDVLVVGAGPVGLAVAIELALRGIRTHVVDLVPEIGSWWTRAMNCNKRSMEHLRRWGLAERLKEINYVPKGWPGNVTLVDTLGGRQIVTVRAEGLGWQRTLPDAAEDALWVTQGQVQQLMLEKARELGVTVSFASKAVSIAQRADGSVSVGVESGGVTRTIAAQYLVGCDGGRSFVRDAAGITYEGSGSLSRVYTLFFDAPDLLDSMRRRGITDAVMYMCAKPEVRGLARLIQGSRWEMQINLPEGTDEASIDAEQTMRKLVGPDIAFTYERSNPYSYFELIADRLRAGRTFIAGDAAHMIPPLGGHNLNLGIGDGVNLGWKLAHVLRGWAGDGLLDSYHSERLPIVRRTRDEVRGNFHRLHSTFAMLAEWLAIPGDDAGAAEQREETGRRIGEHIYPQWLSDGIVLDLRYTGSPVVAAEADAPRPPTYEQGRYQPCAAPGHRAPMHRGADGVPLYARFGPEYTLLDLAPSAREGAAAARALEAAGLPVTHLHLPDDELRALYGKPLTLIRPDQHVAWRGERLPADAQALVATLTGRAHVDARAAA